MTAVEMIQHEMDDVTVSVPSTSSLSIVVATDGSETADAAFVAARLIEEKRNCRVTVLSVLEPLPLYLPGPEALSIPPAVETNRVAAMRETVLAQTRKFDHTGMWDVDIRIGRPAEVIGRFAREHGAHLIIIGSHRHGVWGRMLGEETAMEIARTADVPLLIAAPGMTRLPRRIMLAMDLRPLGLAVAPRALEAVADTSTVSCVHVKPRSEFLGIDWVALDSEYEIAMWDRFREMETMLDKSGFRADFIALSGDVTRELARFAPYSKTELVVVGINRRRGRLRTSGGRLAGRMLRSIDASVLIVPGDTLRPAGQSSSPGAVTDVIQDPERWSHAMKAFTNRNAGRLCTLEIDDPELGALVEAHSYPLLGVDYDHRDGRLTVMLGDTSGTDRHLARSVPRPESISILTNGGKDSALAVVHGAGQTLLTF
jgi:nucleotide-binding universal stress UspA family protein